MRASVPAHAQRTGGLMSPGRRRPASIAPCDPVGRAVGTVALLVRRALRQGELVTGLKMPLLIADLEPHLALPHDRLRGEGMSVRAHDGSRRRVALDALVEAAGASLGGERLECGLLHHEPSARLAI